MSIRRQRMERMHVYSDSKVCEFLKGITLDQIIVL